MTKLVADFWPTLQHAIGQELRQLAPTALLVVWALPFCLLFRFKPAAFARRTQTRDPQVPAFIEILVVAVFKALGSILSLLAAAAIFLTFCMLLWKLAVFAWS
jgi:hypothetical protein